MIRPGNETATAPPICNADVPYLPTAPSSSTKVTSMSSVASSSRPSFRARVQRRWKTIMFVCVVVGVAMCIRYLRIGNYMEILSIWTEHHVALGVLAMVGMFVVSVVVGIPATVLEALCGFLFGWVGGALVSTLGKTTGSVLAFMLGRYFLGDVVVVWMRKYPIVHAISLVFASDATTSWQLLFCAQLSYMPLTIKCYMLSVLHVPTGRFVVTNFVCGIPYSVFWSYVGSQAKDAAKLFSDEGKARNEKLVIMGCGIGSGLLGLVAVGYYTKKKLAELQHATHHQQQHAIRNVRVGWDTTTEGSSNNSAVSCAALK